MANSDPYNKPIRLKPEVVVLAIGFILAFTVIPYLVLSLHFLDRIHSAMKAQRLSYVWLVVLVGVIVIGLAAVL